MLLQNVFTDHVCVCVCVNKQDLALNNLKWLICHKTKGNQLHYFKLKIILQHLILNYIIWPSIQNIKNETIKELLRHQLSAKHFQVFFMKIKKVGRDKERERKNMHTYTKVVYCLSIRFWLKTKSLIFGNIIPILCPR